MLKQIYLYIYGNVIGVGFRLWTKTQAKNLGLAGWVKNVGGHVETLIQGEKENLKAMIKALKKGPPLSRVDNIKVIEQEVKEILEDFEIKL